MNSQRKGAKASSRGNNHKPVRRAQGTGRGGKAPMNSASRERCRGTVIPQGYRSGSAGGTACQLGGPAHVLIGARATGRLLGHIGLRHQIGHALALVAPQGRPYRGAQLHR